MPRGNPNWQPGGSDYRPAGGDGWGGAATGSGRRSFSDDWQPEQEDKDAGRKSKAMMRAALNRRRKLYAEQLDDLALNSTNEAVKLNAVKAIIEILDGKPVQEVSGPDGAPLPSAIAVSFIRPPE